MTGPVSRYASGPDGRWDLHSPATQLLVESWFVRGLLDMLIISWLWDSSVRGPDSRLCFSLVPLIWPFIYAVELPCHY